MIDLPGALKRRPWTQRLGVRLATLMAAALLPLGIVAYLQTSNLAREAQGRTEEALMGESLRAAAGEIRAINTAQGLVAGLAHALPDLIADNDSCIKLMRDVITDSTAYSLVSFVPENGLMTCSSNGQVFDYSDIPLFKTLIAAREPVFTISPDGPVSGTSVFGVVRPVFDNAEVYLGYVSVWIPHDRLRFLKDVAEDDGQREVQFWSFNKQGEVLTASMGLDAVTQNLPADSELTSFVGKNAQVFHATSKSGKKTTYATIPVVRNELYIMSSWTTHTATSDFILGVGATWFPIVMWLAGLGMSIWAAEILVVRHVRALNHSIAAFAGGHRRHNDLSLSGAPLELNEMAEAYSTMTDDIMRNEASLEDEVHQKEVLLREVHHRVKNNLQLIASIMNMQMRQARTPEAKGLLKGLQERIMALATIHRGLYQTTGLSDIYSQELLSDITRQTVNLATGPGRRINVTTDFDDIRLTPDQAVPLSLLLTEALTNSIKYASGADGEAPQLSVTMKRLEDGHAVLTVLNTISDTPEPVDNNALNTSTGLGAQLLVAFAQQIGGTLAHSQTKDTYKLEVMFAVAGLEEGENRTTPATEDDTPADETPT